MARTRKSAAPYSAQLKKFLSTTDDSSRTFSPAGLEQVFDPKPNENRRTTINRIHLELRKAWEEGDVVAFVAPDGTELCEKGFCVNGSAGVQHPRIYGLPGADSPEPGYAPTTYAEFLRLKADGNGHHKSGNGTRPTPDEPAGSGGEIGEETGGPDREANGDPDDEHEVDDDLVELSLRHKVPGPAPSWLPDRLLAHIVTLPKAAGCWRDGLDQASKSERLQLIRAGVRRKGPIDALTATRMVMLCRSEKACWSRAFSAAVSQYLEWGEWIDEDDLAALKRAPDEFFLEHDEQYHPAAIVLCGLSLGADAEALTFVAEEAATLLDEEEGRQTISAQEELRHRASSLEAEAAELRRQLRDEQKETETLRRAAARLNQAPKGQSSTADTGVQLAEVQKENRDLVAANAELLTRLEMAEEQAQEREELREQIAQLEHQRDELVVRVAAGDNERTLREQAEARLQEQIAEARRMERELQETGELRGPVDDVAALARALAKPIGNATEHAARRLAAGRPFEGDPGLLQFASAFGELTASIVDPGDTAPRADPPEPLGPPQDESLATASENGSVPAYEIQEPAASATGFEVVEGEMVEPEPDAAEIERPRQLVNRRARRSLLVHPFGGAGEVGGSAIVVQTRSGHTVLLDAGQRVKGEYGIDTQSPFHHSLPTVDALDAIIVSHAHIDHIGSLPVLYREYQRDRSDRLPIMMSEPTRRVGEIMMRDSAKIQHKREYLTRGALAELTQSDFAAELDLKPAYTEADIFAALEAVEILEPRQPCAIPGTSLTVKLLPVAHVLGSCAVHLTDDETGATLLYTGDLGPLTETQRTLPDFGGVNGLDPADVVIMESTYALASDIEREGRRTTTREDSLRALYRAARKAADAGGHMLLPAFALGRTQELLRVIEEATATGDLPPGDVYIGGMGERISEVYSGYKGKTWVAPGEMRRATEMNRWLNDGTAFDDAVDEAVSRTSFSYFICLAGDALRRVVTCVPATHGRGRTPRCRFHRIPPAARRRHSQP